MKKFVIQFVLLILVLFVALYLGFKNFDLLGQKLPDQESATMETVNINGTKINVEVANSTAKRIKGLGDRDSLGQYSGMLFVFQSRDTYSFWMKGMRFPLDIIFIDGDKIIYIAKDVPVPAPNTPDESLPRVTAQSPFDKVLEVNQGFTDAHNINVGDTILGI